MEDAMKMNGLSSPSYEVSSTILILYTIINCQQYYINVWYE